MAGIMRAGEDPFTAYSGAWAGYDTEKNAGATGGSINLQISGAESARYANVSGIIQVPDLRRQPGVAATTAIFREFSGRVNLRTGAIHAKCERGIIRGHVDRNGHGVVGRLRVNSGRYQIRGAYFADDTDFKGTLN